MESFKSGFGWLSDGIDQATRFAAEGIESAKQSAQAAAAEAERLAAEARNYAGSTVIQTKHGAECLFDDAVWTAKRPFAVTTKACEEILIQATSTGAFALIGSVVFPPAAPFLVGYALLQAPVLISQSIDHASYSVDADRKKAVARREVALQKALGDWHKLPPQVSMKTDHLSMVIDTKTGEAEGVVTSGVYAGQKLSTLSAETLAHLRDTAPDEETKSVLTAWLNRALT